MQSGITLIALVISIIVMLILAGVSISAIVGDDGILAKTQYASFINEMAAIEEAVQMWKVNQDEMETAIPTNGICQANVFDDGVRIKGEIGFYRVWNTTKVAPATSITSSPEEFDGAFQSEMVLYPGGVEDLYYLNNDALGISTKKQYIIDASNGMIYSTVGVSINNVRVHSSNMAKAVNSGILDMPLFTVAEVSAGAAASDGQTLAGNTGAEYMDENGNNVYLGEDGKYHYKDGTEVPETTTVDRNENYNPNGFRIISSSASNNIFKLYNNGDLYAKGVKGSQLVTSEEEMRSIANNVWSKFTVPSEIGSYKKIIQGEGAVYVIDSNDELWAWGSNGSNKFGLTQSEQIEYTGREPVKLNVGGKKVRDVWDTGVDLYVATLSNELYGCGRNDWYHLGLGHNNQVESFSKIEVPNVQNIKDIIGGREDHWMTWKIITYNDGTFYGNQETYLYYGQASIMGGTVGNVKYKYFFPIFNGIIYDPESTPDNLIQLKSEPQLDIDQDIKYVAENDARGFVFLKKDGTLWSPGKYSCYLGTTWAKENAADNYYKFNGDLSSGIKDYYSLSNAYVVLKDDGTVWASGYINKSVGFETPTKTPTQVIFPDDVTIKDVYTHTGAVYYLTDDNVLYGSSSNFNYIGESTQTFDVVKIKNAPEITSLYSKSTSKLEAKSIGHTTKTTGCFLLEDKNGEIWSIGSNAITQRNNILQTSWIKIASGIKDVAVGGNNNIAYIDNSNNVYVAGDDARILGLNISTVSSITSFTHLDNSLINGKVKNVYFSGSAMYVLLNNNELYATGIYSVPGTSGANKNPGWSDPEDKFELQKIDFGEVPDEDGKLQGISMFSTASDCNEKMAILKDELYVWGTNYFGPLGATNSIPKKQNNINSNVDISSVDKIWATHDFVAFKMNDGKFYFQGEGSSNDNKNTYMGSFPIGDQSALINNERIKDIVGSGATAYIILTEEGNVYGWGAPSRLGVNSTSTTPISTITKLNITNVDQISVGSGFFIAVKKDGSVWGTGNNQYGVLGRWVGSPRGSRYRTAFEWVECPDLEV